MEESSIILRDRDVHYPVEDEKFRLTLYDDSNKIDSVNLMLLKEEFCKRFGEEAEGEQSQFQSVSVIEPHIFRQQELFLVQSSSMIYPETDSCVDAGWIACNSILSGLYGRGISECESVTLDLIMRSSVTNLEAQTVIDGIVSGFKGCAEEAGAEVKSGSLVAGSYVTIGGVATAICHKNDLMARDKASVGDKIVLTKPLGTLAATRGHVWHYKRRLVNERAYLVPKVEHAFKSAIFGMRRSNKVACMLMKKYNAHAVIDINGFSFSKCAKELAKIQKNPVDFKINRIPLIRATQEIDEFCSERILKGESEELCGGLLICFPSDTVESFVQEFTATEDQPCFVIGEVTPGDRKINIVDNTLILPVTLHEYVNE